MKIIALDLSSTLIGLTIGIIEDLKIKKFKTIPVIPRKPNGKNFGYSTKTPVTIENRSGTNYSTFLYPGEHFVNRTTSKERMTEFKKAKHKMVLMDIGKQLGAVLEATKPDLVIIEENSSFNGILTTKLLGEVAGGIFFWCGASNTQMAVINVKTARSLINRMIPHPDIILDGKKVLDTKFRVKRQLVEYFEKKGFETKSIEEATTDETDSLLLLVYYLEKVIVRGNYHNAIRSGDGEESS